MTRRYTFLAAALMLLAATACRAAEIGAAQVPADAVPATPAVAAAPAIPVAPVAPPVAAAPGCGCGCQYCGEGPHGDCWQRLLDWLTYCPPHAPCCCGHCGCCGKGCTPCCTPLYMYFLDRCSCTLGYHGPAHCPVCCGPGGPRSPGGVIYAPPTAATGEPYPSSTNSASGQ